MVMGRVQVGLIKNLTYEKIVGLNLTPELCPQVKSGTRTRTHWDSGRIYVPIGFCKCASLGVFSDFYRGFLGFGFFMFLSGCFRFHFFREVSGAPASEK
jgi:hypothetical protein